MWITNGFRLYLSYERMIDLLPRHQLLDCILHKSQNTMTVPCIDFKAAMSPSNSYLAKEGESWPFKGDTIQTHHYYKAVDKP